MTKLKTKLSILTNKAANVKLSLLDFNIKDVREKGSPDHISVWVYTVVIGMEIICQCFCEKGVNFFYH